YHTRASPLSCVFYASRPTEVLLSFPTRRSSDLDVAGLRRGARLLRESLAGEHHRRRRPPLHGERPGHGGLRRIARTLAVERRAPDRKSTRLNSSHVANSYAVFCLKKKKTQSNHT